MDSTNTGRLAEAEFEKLSKAKLDLISSMCEMNQQKTSNSDFSSNKLRHPVPSFGEFVPYSEIVAANSNTLG